MGRNEMTRRGARALRRIARRLQRIAFRLDPPQPVTRSKMECDAHLMRLERNA